LIPGTRNLDIEQRILDAVDRMPAFPRSVERIISLTRNIDCEPKAIVEVLETDPIMAARVLRTINSAFYALPRPISSMAHAVVMLGINTIKNLALAISAMGMMPARNPAGFDTAAYLKHSLSVAGVARLVAYRLGDADPSETYIAGLLHDFGKILFAVYLPREFSAALDLSEDENLPLYLAEQQIMGIDHAHAGALMVDKWKLPQELGDCIAAHHDAEIGPGMLRCLFIADQLVKRQSPDSDVADLPPNLAPSLGDSWEAISNALPEQERIIEEISALSR